MKPLAWLSLTLLSCASLAQDNFPETYREPVLIRLLMLRLDGIWLRLSSVVASDQDLGKLGVQAWEVMEKKVTAAEHWRSTAGNLPSSPARDHANQRLEEARKPLRDWTQRRTFSSLRDIFQSLGGFSESSRYIRASEELSRRAGAALERPDTEVIPQSSWAGEPENFFPDVPEHHRVYEGVAKLKAGGVLIEYPTENRRHRIYTVEDLVRSFQKAISTVESNRGWYATGDAPLSDRRDAAVEVAALLFEAGSVTRNIKAFEPTSKDLLRAADKLAWHPILTTPFTDVPKDHWAANAVENLRQSGVVRGFPDRRFKG